MCVLQNWGWAQRQLMWFHRPSAHRSDMGNWNGPLGLIWCSQIWSDVLKGKYREPFLTAYWGHPVAPRNAPGAFCSNHIPRNRRVPFPIVCFSRQKQAPRSIFGSPCQRRDKTSKMPRAELPPNPGLCFGRVWQAVSSRGMPLKGVIFRFQGNHLG